MNPITPPPQRSYNMKIMSIDRLMKIGEALAILKAVLHNEDIFSKTSKHDPYFDSSLESEADRLEDLRWFVQRVETQIEHVIALMEGRDGDD